MTLDAVLAALRPELAEKAREHMRRAKALGIETTIYPSGGLRTPEKQEQLWEQGRKKIGWIWVVVDKQSVVTNARTAEKSPHGRGAAYDLTVLVNSKPTWDDPPAYAELGEIAHELGLTWGGDFKSLASDVGHFEMSGWKDLPFPYPPLAA